MPHKLKSSLFLLSIFILTYLICLPFTNNYCHLINWLDFDTQNVFFWDHLAEMGFEPYKDTFYLYGFLFFYKSQSLIYFLIYTLISPLLLTLTYFTVIHRLFSSWYLKFVIYLTLLSLVINNLSTTTYGRYGLLPTFALLSALILYKFRPKKNIPYLTLGIISGLLLFVSNADALYLMAAQLILIGYDHFAVLGTRKIQIIISAGILKIAFYFLGFLLGSVPFIFHLSTHHLWSILPHLITDITFGAEYGKTPYLIDNAYELFLILSLVVGFVVLLIRIYQHQLRHTYTTYLILASFTSLLIMFQKHLVRQMANILFYFAFILILILFSQVKKWRPPLQLILYLAFFISFMTYLRLPVTSRAFTHTIQAYLPAQILNTLNYSSRLCRIDQINWSQLQLTPAHQQVGKYLFAQSPSPRIFSFPYDPLFYLLLRQKPAPYPNLYNASPDALQKLNLNFIKNQEVNYVIYNLRAQIIDEVPDYLRGRTTLHYLINNFTPVKYYDPFVILKKNPSISKGSFFSLENQVQYPALYRYLGNLSWGWVPYTEARYKDNHLLSGSSFRSYFDDPEALTRYLSQAPLDATNAYILFHTPANIPATNEVTLTDEKEFNTKFFLNQKPNSNYLINLSNLPSFMDGGQLAAINFTTPPVYIWLLKNTQTGNIW